MLGGQRTRVFYADPYSAFQKGSIENNHEMIRKFIPKGISFNLLTDETVAEMINNINSYKRASLNWLSPYEKAQMILDSKLLKDLGFIKIKSDDVKLKPILLKRENHQGNNLKNLVRKHLSKNK